MQQRRREWEEHDRAEDYLLDAGRLAAIDEWSERKQPHLTNGDQVFIELSRERRDRQFQAQLEREQRLREEAERRAIAETEKKIEAEVRAKESEARARVEKRRKQFAIIAAVITMGMGVLVQTQSNREAQQRAISIESSISKAEIFFKAHNELEAIEASVEALSKLKEIGREDSDALARISKVISNVRERDRLKIHDGAIYGLSFSPDGELLVSGGVDRTIKIWNLEKNRIVPTKQKHDAVVRNIKFSPNGQMFASASLDGTVKLWDRQGNLIYTFRYGDYVYDISFNKDNNKLAASGRNKGVIIWDIINKKRIITIGARDFLVECDPRIYSLDFHPANDSILVTTGYKKYEIILWNLKNPGSIEPIYIDKKPLQGEAVLVRFSPRADLIAYGEEGGTIKVRDLSGKLRGKADGTGDSLYHIQFNSDGSLISAAGSNRGVRIWKVRELLEYSPHDKRTPSIETITVNTGTVHRISFQQNNISSDEATIASADKGGTIRIWNIFPRYSGKNHSSVKTSTLLAEGCKILHMQKRKLDSTKLTLSKLCID
jgi:WD40 repeat protein